MRILAGTSFGGTGHLTSADFSKNMEDKNFENILHMHVIEIRKIPKLAKFCPCHSGNTDVTFLNICSNRFVVIIGYTDISEFYTFIPLLLRRIVVNEIVGAQDFLPDFKQTSALNVTCSNLPRYKPLANAMKKTEEWIENARVIYCFILQRIIVFNHTFAHGFCHTFAHGLFTIFFNNINVLEAEIYRGV